jgi:membrane-associated protease RseP (regulator of RpoE activity)
VPGYFPHPRTLVRGLLWQPGMESALRKYVLTINLLFLAVCAAIFAHAARVVVESGLAIVQAARSASDQSSGHSPAPPSPTQLIEPPTLRSSSTPWAGLTTSGMSARVVPEMRDGFLVGVRLYSVAADGPLARLGLRNGDVLQSVDGIRLESPERALDAYARLHSARRPVLVIEREGRPLTLGAGCGE